MTKDVRPWEVVTERENEAHRRGVGALELQRTLEHLRRRGDATARYMFEGEIESGWREVRLDRPLSIGGSHR